MGRHHAEFDPMPLIGALMPKDPDTSRFTIVTPPVDPYSVFALFVKMTCPMVCRGYLDGTENWHQLCENKARAAMASLGVPLPEEDHHYPPPRNT